MSEHLTQRTFAWCDMEHEVKSPGRTLGVSIGMLTVSLLVAAGFWGSAIVDGLSRSNECVAASTLLVVISLVYLIYAIARLKGRALAVAPSAILPASFEPLCALRWPIIRCSDTGGGPAAEVRKDSGVRAIVDSSLIMALDAIEIPPGLVEPATCKPGTGWDGGWSWAGIVLGIPVRFILGMSMLGTAGFFSGPARLCFFVLGLLLLWSCLTRVLALPAIQRRLHGIPVLGAIGRRNAFQTDLIAGPGFVKYGRLIWRADEDLMLVRCRRYASSASTVEVMFAGKAGRVRMTLPGLSDQAFIWAWQAWHCPEVRPELAQSDLS